METRAVLKLKTFLFWPNLPIFAKFGMTHFIILQNILVFNKKKRESQIGFDQVKDF